MNELYHHGIHGQRWGVRRYQNEDGSLTEAGRSRYYDSNGSRLTEKGEKKFFKGNSSELTRKGKKELKKAGNSSDYGKAIRANQFSRKYNEENAIKSYNRAAEQMNQKIKSFNSDWEKKHGKDSFGSKEYKSEYGKLWKKTYEQVLLRDFGEHPAYGKDWVKMAFSYNMFDD